MITHAARTTDVSVDQLIAIACGSVKSQSRTVYVAKKTGRPALADPKSERSLKPWIACGVSQRTYYRRKAAARVEAPEPPQQHLAHVAAWFATLGPIARLEHRAFVRRCHLSASRRQPAHEASRASS